MGKRFQTYIKRLRWYRNMSLREVERKTGISNSYLSQIERGIRGIPTVGYLKRLADVYDISLVKIFMVVAADLENKSVEEIENKIR